MVTIYSKSMCPNCVLAKRLLEKYGVAYKEVHIDQNPEVLEMLRSRGHRAAPVIMIDGQPDVSGFDVKAIEAALRAAGLI